MNEKGHQVDYYTMEYEQNGTLCNMYTFNLFKIMSIRVFVLKENVYSIEAKTDLNFSK